MDTSPASSPTIDPILTEESVAALKRRIVALEEENIQLGSKIACTPGHSWRREGRAIRRLVCIMDPVTDLIAEYDRRIILAEDNSDLEDIESTPEEDRTFRSFKKLLVWCPSLKKAVSVPTELALACNQLRRGADGARGDDASTLKHRVIRWLNDQQPPPSPPLVADDKANRGFTHDLTGGLLCPVDFNWLDETVRTAIRHYHPSYAVTAHMWPSFLYPQGRYDPQNPADGLFKGELLVRAFRCIFTSPTSSQREIRTDGDDDASQEPPMKRRHTRGNVASLLKMRSVEPRAIAYVAVQLRFALSTSDYWAMKDENFDYEVFYHNVVDWFELTGTPTSAQSKAVKKLIRWWNRVIFGRRYASTLEPQDITTLSVARSRARDSDS